MQRIQGDGRRGMTTMEFALILPFVIVFVMGVIETGTMFYSWLTVQKAAQSGARFAATGQGVEEGDRMVRIVQETEGWLASLDKGGKEIVIRSWPGSTVSGEGTEGNAGGPCQLVEVAVTYAYHPFTPIVGALLPDVVGIQGSDRKLNEPWRPCDG